MLIDTKDVADLLLTGNKMGLIDVEFIPELRTILMELMDAFESWLSKEESKTEKVMLHQRIVIAGELLKELNRL